MAVTTGWNTFPAGFDSSHVCPLYDETGAYFFNNTEYIRMTRGNEGPGTLDFAPRSIASLGYPAPFNQGPFDAALYSEGYVYFFKGQSYMRCTRSDGQLGPHDPGYPTNIAPWGWEGAADFGGPTGGISAALNSGGVDYFFEKFNPKTYAVQRYIRVTRGETGPGTVDAGYPQPITNWGWRAGFPGPQGVTGALFSGEDGGGIKFGPWP
ncbi:hemopexin repeat-containing protein [Granulicella arctica]|uniref:hemopexin repeat-containing protein n=1 Tax=Granulicella arctica TaxID=940613 RepID=UPI0021DFC89A|nr:hemopexin repeat-containing protein [Granulicella arctica]